MKGVLVTMLLNPRLGDRYRSTLDELHAEGHELALHGGTDHVVWQRSLSELDETELDALFRPAYEMFEARYGTPKGHACPGFAHNTHVYEMLDAYGFAYSSDEPGEEPFQPVVGNHRYSHFQVPVNIVGDGNVPIIEQMLATGQSRAVIVATCVEQIEAREFALLYGHPYVEGIRADILRGVIDAVSDTHVVVTVAEYLERWRRARIG